jgi:hypothetical protein
VSSVVGVLIAADGEPDAVGFLLVGEVLGDDA